MDDDKSEVVKTADGWVMLYEGGSGSQSGIAISEDGKNFKRYAGNPILTTKNMVSEYAFFQGAFFHHEDSYFYLIEAGNGRIGTDIFLYTIEGSLLVESTSDNQETDRCYQIHFNRDESRQRPEAQPPKTYTEKKTRVLMPVDSSAGGTWVFVNQWGLSVCLLNNYQASEKAKPGTRYHYSNLGIALLAHCIEITTGQSFRDFSSKNILGPLAMNQSTWSLSEVDQDQHVSYYYEIDKERAGHF